MSDQSWNNSSGNAAQFFLAQTDHHYFNVEVPSSDTKPIKKLMLTSWFQANFAVYLWL